MVKWYLMISFHHSRLLHTAIWQVFLYYKDIIRKAFFTMATLLMLLLENDFFKEFCKKLWKKNNVWIISRLVDKSFVPGTQQTSVLYWRLSDFTFPTEEISSHQSWGANDPQTLCSEYFDVSSWDIFLRIPALFALFVTSICPLSQPRMAVWTNVTSDYA